MARNVVDSSGWIEFLTDGENAASFRPAIIDMPRLIVPTIVIFEVTRLLLRVRDEHAVDVAFAYLTSGQVEPLDTPLATKAAIIAHANKLPMADSIIYATAQRFGATLWTQDADFETLPGVRYFARLKRP